MDYVMIVRVLRTPEATMRTPEATVRGQQATPWANCDAETVEAERMSEKGQWVWMDTPVANRGDLQAN